jgi:hypothetical protein
VTRFIFTALALIISINRPYNKKKFKTNPQSHSTIVYWTKEKWKVKMFWYLKIKNEQMRRTYGCTNNNFMSFVFECFHLFEFWSTSVHRSNPIKRKQ